MRLLICHNGTPAASVATHLGGMVAAPFHAETMLLGIAERASDDKTLRGALERDAAGLRAQGLDPKIVIAAGDPIRQILNQTSLTKFDLVLIGAERKRQAGRYWRSEKTYELIRSIPAPVLVALGQCDQMKKFLVCTGGKKFIAPAIALTGKIAAAVGASISLFHVMAEPPVMYADLIALEEDPDRILTSQSELGLNLTKQKHELESLGVPTTVRIRHGFVLDRVFEEVRDGNYDLIVTGTPPARGIFRPYLMGDLTRSILNRADCPVLVARSGEFSRLTFRRAWRRFVGRKRDARAQ